MGCAQLDRTVLQRDQAMSARRDRYDKLAANYLAFIKLASIRIWLRAIESAPLVYGAGIASRLGMRVRRISSTRATTPRPRLSFTMTARAGRLTYNPPSVM